MTGDPTLPFVPPTPAEVARDLAPLEGADESSVLRFAPSPNGPLHPGHAYSALLNRRLADMSGARMLVRIEDLDRARCTRELERAMLADLASIGVESDGPLMRQSERAPAYCDALASLRERGLVYPAFLTRGQLRREVEDWEQAHGEAWPRGPDGVPHYPACDRERPRGEAEARVNTGEAHAWRLDTTRALASLDGSAPDDATLWGDPVLWRVDNSASYHLAVVVDDAAQGVTHVVRGADLAAATSVHRLLQRLLELPEPRMRHHALVRGADGAKLSKSRGDAGLSDWTGKGGDLATLLGLPAEKRK